MNFGIVKLLNKLYETIDFDHWSVAGNDPPMGKTEPYNYFLQSEKILFLRENRTKQRSDKLVTLREAPPTRKPSTSGWPASSLLLAPLTEPGIATYPVHKR